MTAIRPGLFLAVLLLSAPSHAVRAPESAVPSIAIPARERLERAPVTVAAALEREFPGQWELEWDARAGALASGRRGVAPSGPDASPAIVLERATAFRDRAAGLGAGAATLERVRVQQFGRAWHVTWRQIDAGRPVFDAVLDLVLTSAGEVVAFRSSLVPGVAAPPARLATAALVASASAALARAVSPIAVVDGVALLPEGGSLRAVPASRLDLRSGHAERWDVLVDAQSGKVLELDDRILESRLEGTATADAPPLYALEAPVERPLPWLHLGLGEPPDSTGAVADGAGRFAFEHAPGAGLPLRAGLVGDFVRVRNASGDPQAAVAVAVEIPGQARVHFSDPEARLDERAIYVHATRIHDWAVSRFGFHLLDFPIPAMAAARHPVTGDADYANAYWDGNGIYFGNGGVVFQNFGLFADVVYHEYTHAVTDYIYRPFGRLRGLQGGAMHEALSDYFACTITGEPEFAERIYRDDPARRLRYLENNLRWPEDAVYEVHADGEIFGGALWDLRRLAGPDVADPLVHFARGHGPFTFATFVDAVLLEDDLQFDDGQAANGSPHRAAILTAFGIHGFGPAAGTGRTLVHEPLHDTEDVGRPRPVRVAFDGGLSSPADALELYYSTDATFLRSPMRREPDGSFTANIPASALGEGSTVRYYLELEAHTRQTHPPGAPDSTHSFRVGPDREPPRIEHVPISSAAAIAWPTWILVRLSDNLGVEGGWVEFWRNGAREASLGFVPVPGDPTSSRAQFPNIGGLGDEIEYRIVAVDASRSHLRATLPATGTIRFTIVSELVETFEAGSGAWLHASLEPGGADPWHRTSVFNHTPGGAAALWCGRETGEYPANAAAALQTESYPVGAGASASVWSWIDAEPNGPSEAFDAGVVQLELDERGVWLPLVPATGYTHVVATGARIVLPPGTACLSGRDSQWRRLQFDLDPFTGHRARLRFLFASDAIATPYGVRGWAIDDFALEPGASDPTDVATGPIGRSRLLRGAPTPNPFSPRVRFALEVPREVGTVRLALFDVRGRRVRALWDGAAPAGPLRLDWDGTQEGGLALPAGVYYYRLESRFGVEHGSIVLVR